MSFSPGLSPVPREVQLSGSRLNVSREIAYATVLKHGENERKQV
jgi:hypothetical protein